VESQGEDEVTLIALYDTETNGLLEAKREKDGSVCPPLDKMHCLAFILKDMSLTGSVSAPRFISASVHYRDGDTPNRGWERMSVHSALALLATADMRVAHNGQDFDERAILRCYPDWKPKPGSKLIDTLLLSRLIYADIHRHGPNNHRLMPFEKRLHSLDAWGKRLGEHKGVYKGGWAEWSEDMQEYLEQDVVVLDKLFTWLWANKPDTTAVDLEHQFAAIIRRMESRGCTFDMEKAEGLLSELQVKAGRLEADLIGAFGEWWAPERRGAKGDNIKASSSEEEDEDAEDEAEQEKRLAEFQKHQATAMMKVPTKSYRAKMVGFPDVTIRRYSEKTGKELKPYVGPPLIEYTAGDPYTPIKRVEFNPSSRQHIWQRLISKYQWKPSKFTKGGKNAPPQPMVDEDVLRGLPYPEADLLAEYFLVCKRLGQLAVGQKAWIKVAVETEHPNGESTWRIHGRVNTNGAATGRCTHSAPNLAQVPKNTAATKDYPNSPELWGTRCRELFIPGRKLLMAGFDGAALELRMLAHYIFPWDQGEYSRLVHEGKKEDGTDPHSWLRDLIGIDLLGAGDLGRDRAKTCMYTELYGGGALKQGSNIIPKATDAEKKELGLAIKRKMAARFTAKADLQSAIEAAVKERGFLMGLDGRILKIRKAHAALNTLLQSAGAVVMKKALVVLDRSLQADGLIPGRDYEYVLNVHDEVQAEILPELQDRYDTHARACLPKAGRLLRLNCPLVGETAFGHSWKDTH
jgi:DNA polymerase I